MSEEREKIATKAGLSLHKIEKPSKILSLIALLIAFLLPYILVKTFPNKRRVIPQNQIVNPLQKTEETIDSSKKPETPSEPTPNVLKPPPPSPVPKSNESQKPSSIKSPENKVEETSSKRIKINKNDTIEKIFVRAGLSAQTTSRLMKEIKHASLLKRIQQNEEIQFEFKDHTLAKIILPYTATQYILITQENEHFKSEIRAHKIDTQQQFLTATVVGSLYATAQKQHIPFTLIRQMTDIFSSEIPLDREVNTGDQFTLVYKAYYVENKLIKTGDIVAVSFRNRKKTYQAIRHTDSRGESSYYTPEGRSLKKAFLRYPVRFSHISSGFSISRYHPILHYRRSHKGVDLAASIGTTILATGDGVVEMIGRERGYGNMIKIKHSQNYSSIYGHMLRFQPGLKRGSYVKRGQTIGFVGQTGLASGPHCHYEFHVNNIPRNPSTIDLPRANNLASRELTRFKQNAQTLIAQLRLYENSRLALSQSSSKTHS